MSELPTTAYDTPDSVLNAITALVAADAAAFMESFVADAALVDAAVRLAASDSSWIETGRGALRRGGGSGRLQERFAALIKVKVKERKAADRATIARPLRVIGQDELIPTVRGALGPSAPVHDEAIIPGGYSLGRDGIKGVSTNGELTTIAHRPLVIRGSRLDEATGAEHLELSWPEHNGQWRTVTVGREAAMSRVELTKLSSYGAPVHSGNAGAAVQYLADYEAANAAVIQRRRVSSHLGWQGDHGKDGFLWGRRLLTAPGDDAGELDPDAVAIADWRDDWIAFSGSDDGDEQIADGLCAGGDEAGWREAIAAIAAYPRVRLALYASLASPFLTILDCEPFMLDWSGMTSLGKTTTLRVAASVWGRSDPTQPGSVLATWNTTRTSAERRAALLNGIPLLLDDSKQARDAKAIAQAIYDLTSGQGRGRGSISGLRRTGAWRGIIMSTGEEKAVDATQDGGTRARVISLCGSPFGRGDAGDLVTELSAHLQEHYGHAGPRFVRHLFAHREAWSEWRRIWIEQINSRRQQHPDNPVAGRVGRYIAAIEVAAAIAHDALALPWEWEVPIPPALWDEICREASEADRPTEALRRVASWAAANQQGFFGRSPTDKAPAGGWLGVWQKDGSSGPWKVITFVPEHLRAFLAEQGFNPEAIIHAWNERGVLETRTDRRGTTKKVSLDGEKTWHYVVRREAIAGLEPADPAESGD